MLQQRKLFSGNFEINYLHFSILKKNLKILFHYAYLLRSATAIFVLSESGQMPVTSKHPFTITPG